MDAFLVAFKIPNFLRRLFAEGAFSQAFVPVLSEYKEKYSLSAGSDFSQSHVRRTAAGFIHANGRGDFNRPLGGDLICPRLC